MLSFCRYEHFDGINRNSICSIKIKRLLFQLKLSLKENGSREIVAILSDFGIPRNFCNLFTFASQIPHFCVLNY
jgi:hypothetical protein